MELGSYFLFLQEQIKDIIIISYGLVVGFGLAPATLEFWVRFPNERKQGVTGAPCVKVPLQVPGGKLLPSWRGAGGDGLLAGTRRRPAAEDGVPPSLQIPPHTHLLTATSPAH